MTKKLALCAALSAALAICAAGASPVYRPGEWGFGAHFRQGFAAREDIHNSRSVAVTLKAPEMPIFWGLSYGFGPHWDVVGVQGDAYLLGLWLAPGLRLFAGLGAYASFMRHDSGIEGESYTAVGFGGRLPVGLSLRPVRSLEFHGAAVPWLGSWARVFRDPGNMGLRHGVGVEVGARIWF